MRSPPLPVVGLLTAHVTARRLGCHTTETSPDLLAESTYSKCSLFPAKRRDRAAWAKTSMR